MVEKLEIKVQVKKLLDYEFLQQANRKMQIIMTRIRITIPIAKPIVFIDI